ncbi:MAG TPA: adenylate kinase [Actinomycetes bacterium]|jgi:adenylate kinase|nr:adenylate kinase [Actinomycetota bacterium]HEV3498109.1 adenylate kinase [Actinomycetes bacterium]HEX2159732.1 adenylate kinase [Actinomycetes bacterium]
MRIVLLGPPGAGKGTQAARVACQFGAPHIATGDIFRANVAEGTELGRTAQEYMDRGDLVPDDVVIAMVAERLASDDCRAGFVLDGFPRTVNQAEALDRQLVEVGSPLDAVLCFEAAEEELLRRLAGRAAAQHRADDAEQTIRHRLEVFAIKTRPLIDYYRHRRLLTMVDGVGRVEEVTVRILDGLPSANGGRSPALALAV